MRGMSHPAPETPTDWDALVTSLIASRQSVPPKRLVAPGPSAEQLSRLVQAAHTAPDHRGLQPWRLIHIADDQRAALADLFEACSRDREPDLPADRIADSRSKAHRAPCLLLAVLCHQPEDPEVPATERAVSLGAALMAMLLAAHGMGLAGMLTSGRAVRTARFAQAFGLAAHEQAVCFVSLGTPHGARRRDRGDASARISPWISARHGPGT